MRKNDGFMKDGTSDEKSVGNDLLGDEMKIILTAVFMDYL